MVNEILEALIPELLLCLSFFLIPVTIDLSAVWKRNLDNTNPLEIKRTELMTEIQIFQTKW